MWPTILQNEPRCTTTGAQRPSRTEGRSYVKWLVNRLSVSGEKDYGRLTDQRELKWLPALLWAVFWMLVIMSAGKAG